jgi:hypothetical protein
MANIFLYKGGAPVFEFPGCDARREFRLPYPERVAGEYGRGDFTLGDNLQPFYRQYQASDLDGMKPGDTAFLLCVPTEHEVTGLYVRTDPSASATTLGCGEKGCVANTMAGVTIDVTAARYKMDEDARTATPTATVSLPAAFAGIDAATEGSKHTFLQEYVPLGEVMMLGIRFVTAPTTPNLTFSDLAGRITLVAKVHDFQYPLMN